MDANRAAKLTREERIILMEHAFLNAGAIFEGTDEGDLEREAVARRLPDGWAEPFRQWFNHMTEYYKTIE